MANEGMVAVEGCFALRERAVCGKTARADLYGGLCVNDVPTMTILMGSD